MVNVKLDFEPGESKKIVTVNLLEGSKSEVEKEKVNLAINPDDDDDGEEEDDNDDIIFFKVILSKPEPDFVKLSRRNCCIVEITNEIEFGDNANSKEHMTMISHFVAKQKLSWGD